MTNKIKKACKKNHKLILKQKITLNVFNNLCLWIGKQVFWYTFFELLKQLFNHFFQLLQNGWIIQRRNIARYFLAFRQAP